MDEFVRSLLTDLGLHDLIERFRDEQIDKESLLCLGDKDIDDLIQKIGPKVRFKQRLEELKRKPMCVQEAVQEQVLPSTSAACENEQYVFKRKLDSLPTTDRLSKIKRQCDTLLGSDEDEFILNKVKGIMAGVHDHLRNHSTTNLGAFLRNKIENLLTDKKELVGVFGKTGAGKSSLINAILEEKDLLPTGSLTACTTVMIKVEANTRNHKYEAEIEFISKEDWKDELWSVKNILCNEETEDDQENTDEIQTEEKDEDEEYNDALEKMTALYGDEWKLKSPENLMETKYFKEIPEFFQSRRKTIQGESAKELSAKVLKYTRTDLSEANKPAKRCFWPLVKCVTVRVPGIDLLKHVTLVDLPGNGDRNKSRDQMWKKVVASCSTVWIVSEMNRAAADRDAWDILTSTCGLMGNGGECQHIYFICTKSDSVDEGDCTAEVSRKILYNNSKAKDFIRKEFNKLNRVKKQFKDDCFEVFTVSSKEFLKSKPNYLQREETEIPRLKELLQSLNDEYDLTLNYVSGAFGILSLIQGAKQRNDPEITAKLIEKLRGTIAYEFQKVQHSMENMHEVFEKCLSSGVERSKDSCEVALKKILNPRVKGGGRGFHKQLRCVLKNKGVYKTKKKKQINLNNTLSNFLTDSIDEEFRKFFPNDAKSGPFYEAIHAFSLHTTGLVQQHKHFELQLIFLNTEEAKIKSRLCKDIRDRKKMIYSCLTETVTETMQECYTKAAEIRGPGSLVNMKHAVETHLLDVKNTMFDRTKDDVLSKLKDLMEHVQKELSDFLLKTIEMSFRSDSSITDFGHAFAVVKKHHDDLLGKKEEDLAWPDLLD